MSSLESSLRNIIHICDLNREIYAIEVAELRHCLQSVSTERRVSSLKNVVDESNKTAVHIAASRGSLNIIKCLLDGISVDRIFGLLKVPCGDGCTAIHLAAYNGHTDIIKYLLEAILVDQRLELLKIQDGEGSTAMHDAAYNGHTDAIKCLLDGISVHQRSVLLKLQDEGGLTAMHHAAYNGHADTIKCLLDDISINQRLELLKIRDAEGRTAIHRAAYNGHTDAVRCLLDDISVDRKLELFNIQDVESGTPLHAAACKGHICAIKSLLEGLSFYERLDLLKIQDRDGATAIHHAAYNGLSNTIKCLLDFISVDQRPELLKIQDGKGRTAIHLAAYNAHTGTIKCLLDDISVHQRLELLRIKDAEGSTAIQDAAYSGDTDTIKYLLDDISEDQRWELLRSEDEEGRTVIHNAAYNGHIDTIRYTMNHLTREQQLNLLKVANNKMETALRMAINRNKNEVAEYLRQCKISAAKSTYKDMDTEDSTQPYPSNMNSSVIHPMSQQQGSIHQQETKLLSQTLPTYNYPVMPSEFSLPINPHYDTTASFTELLLASAPPPPMPPPPLTELLPLPPPLPSQPPLPGESFSTVVVKLLPKEEPLSQSNKRKAPSEGFPLSTSKISRRQGTTRSEDVTLEAHSLPDELKYESRVCKRTVKVKTNDRPLVFPFEDHMTVQEFIRLLKDECDEDYPCYILDQVRTRYSKSVRLELLEAPFTVVVGNVETVVKEISRDDIRRPEETSLIGQQIAADGPSTSRDYPYIPVRSRFKFVHTPRLAIELMEYVHEQLSSGRANSINDALKETRKNRKTIDRFRYIYYMSVVDKDKLIEIQSRWISESQRGGVCRLGELCELETDWKKVEEAANDKRLTIFGKKRKQT